MTNPPPYGEFPPVYGELPPTPQGYEPPPQGYLGYGAYPAYEPPPPRGTNAMAIAALVSSFLIAPLGIVFGHISLSQLKKSNEEGRGLAIAGLVIGYVLTAVIVLGVVVSILFTALLINFSNDLAEELNEPGYPGFPSSPTYPTPVGSLPPFTPPATLGSNCQYPLTTEAPSRPVDPPRTGKVSTTPPIVDATVVTNLGSIGLQLDNAKAPCTVNNFVSLAEQGFFDKTPCHRLTTDTELHVLQCGDPTGSGTGGPGYRFPNEYPTNQFRLTDPALSEPVTYPRGTLAMANAGSGTNGSQFFLVYEDSQLPPTYTVFGSIDTVGLDLLDEVAAAGVEDGGTDGEPKTAVMIESVR